MTDGLKIGAALLAGLGLGTFFFGGLWWTVQRGLCSRHPAMLFLGSLLLRTLLTVAGFYFASRGDWRNLVARLAGFLLARMVITRAVDSSAKWKPHLLEGGVR